MSEKGIFKNIKESLDEIMSGRRYLISTVEKLRKGLPDLAPSVEQLKASIDSIAAVSSVATELASSLTQLKEALEGMKTLSTTIDSMKNDLQNMSNNVMALRPILDSIRDYSQRQENGLRGIAQAIQEVMGQMGQILARLR